MSEEREKKRKSNEIEHEQGEHWFDTIYKEYERKGDFKDLPGKGKPLPRESVQGDTLTGILKNANYKPPWLELQHEIGERISNLITLIEKQGNHKEIRSQLEAINQKIRKYNRACPPILQKGLVSVNNLKNQYKHWV
ncbi:MAG TPA: DUF1992 domain-containing protein [Bacillales bacterium]|nr:DUF1992 domain-containing protein [Bacillales bacterium]